MQQFTLNTLLNVLINNFFEGYKCVHYISNGNNNFLLNESKTSMVVDKIDSRSNFTLKICDAFVIQVDDPVEIFKNIEWQISHRKTNKYSFRRYLFIAKKDRIDSLTNVSYTKHVFDLLVVSQSQEYIELYHFGNSSSGLQLVLVDIWFSNNKMFLLNADLFPNKMKGQYFYVGTFNFPPYVILDSMHGFELRIIVEFCQRHDLLLKVMDYGAYNWGDVYENWTGVELLGDVSNGICHVGLAGFYWQTLKPKYLDYVVPVVKIATNCIVPVPTLETSLMIAFLPFDKEIWIFILAAFLTLVLVWKFSINLIDRFASPSTYNICKVQNWYCSQQRKTEVSFTLAKLLLQQPISQRTNPIDKHFLIINFVLVLLISIAYPGKLFNIIRHPRFSKPIKNVDDLNKSGIKWGTTHESYVDMLPKEKYADLLKRLVVADEESLLELIRQKDFVLVIEHLNNGFVPPTTVDLFKYMTLKSDMFWLWGTFMLPMNSVWQPSLQMHTLQVHENGLSRFWEKEAFREMGMYKYQRQLKAHDTFELSPLSLWQIRGVFLVWGIGIFISSAAFIVENYDWFRPHTIVNKC